VPDAVAVDGPPPAPIRSGPPRTLRPPRLPAPDVFTLAIVANVFLCLLGSYLYRVHGSNNWVDGSSVNLLWWLGLENIVMLLLARRTNNPFVAILVGLTTVFYMGRVDSLLYDPFSIAFTFAGFPITESDVNATLRLVFWGNLAVFLGVQTAKVRPVAAGGEPAPGMATRLVIALALVYLANFFLGSLLGGLGRIFAALLTIALHPHMVLLMALTFMSLGRKRGDWIDRIVLPIMVVMFVVLTVIIGSRSGALVLAILALIAVLARQKRFEVRWRWLFVAAVAMPIAVTAFNVATLVRLSGYKPGVAVSTQRLGAALAFDASGYGNLKNFIRPVADRMGYLDYATVMVAGADYYKPVVSFGYYMKSVVDNLLSPGFDVFDTPRASSSIRFIPTSDLPTLARAREDYSSSQLTAYGEWYILLPGWWRFLGLAFMGYAFARLFGRIRARDDYHLYLYRGVVLYGFHNWVNSFGLDWMFIESTAWAMTLLFFAKFAAGFGGHRRRAPAPAAGVHPVGPQPSNA
jgi:hypothetical protein